MMFSGTETFLFMFSINLRCFIAYLKTGQHIGSNLELSLNSVVESAKPNLDFSQQSSFEMLVRKRLKGSYVSIPCRKGKKMYLISVIEV